MRWPGATTQRAPDGGTRLIDYEGVSYILAKSGENTKKSGV